MIPLHENERLPYDDPDGVRYFFRTLTGENENKYLEIITSDSPDRPLADRRKTLNDLVDFLLIGWEPIGEKKISIFPEDGKPSRFFNSTFKNAIVEQAMKSNNLSLPEKKT